MSVRTISEETVETRMDADVNIFVGLPGAGKTEACRITEDVTEGEADSFEVSTFVRNEYHREMGDGVGDNELGRWAADKKDEHGNDYFVREMAETLADPYPPAEVVNIAGVRSPAEADAVRDVFGAEAVTIITIWTLPDIRYERLSDREGDYTHEEFSERKERELWDWGCIEFFTNEDYWDYIVPNNFGLDGFESSVKLAVRGTEAYTEYPWPDLPSKEHVAQYL